MDSHLIKTSIRSLCAIRTIILPDAANLAVLPTLYLSYVSSLVK
jgi:hypothetical protein